MMEKGFSYNQVKVPFLLLTSSSLPCRQQWRSCPHPAPALPCANRVPRWPNTSWHCTVLPTQHLRPAGLLRLFTCFLLAYSRCPPQAAIIENEVYKGLVQGYSYDKAFKEAVAHPEFSEPAAQR